MQNLGIEYKLTGEIARGEVASYHRKPSPLDLNKTKHSIDISGLKRPARRSILIDQYQGEYYSQFSIGFEVEKVLLHRNSVREYELFCGFERDASCGYEAVTHILPLLPAGSWRTKVFDMMHKAEKVIDDRYSPSDKTCGGHISVSVSGYSADDIRRIVRPYSGIILALFRHRLNNRYCGANRRMQGNHDDTYDSTNAGIMYSPYSNHSKYQLALMKGNVLEFRLPSRFESVKQMMRRYELFYELLDYAFNVKGSYGAFIKKITPLVISMYNGNVQTANEVLGLSKYFQDYINTGEMNPKIRQFL